MTLSYVGAGSTPTTAGGTGTGSTSATPGVPTGWVDNDLIVVAVGSKPDTTTIATPTGWTLIGTATGGTGTQGAGTGATRMTWFSRVKDATWTTMPSFANSGGSATWAQAFVVRSSIRGDYETAMASGSRTTASTSWSVACGSNPGFTTGDLCLFGGVPTATTPTASAESITATGATFGTKTEISEPKTGTGNDAGGFIAWCMVTAGTSTGNPTITATLSSSTGATGVSAVVRVREVAAAPPGEAYTGAFQLAGTGQAALDGDPRMTATLARSGPGTVVFAGSSPAVARTLSLAGTGGLSFGATPSVTDDLAASGTGSLNLGGQPAPGADLATAGGGDLSFVGASEQVEAWTDDFNRPAGPLGPNWAVTAGGMTIGDAGQVIGGGNSAARWVQPVTGPLQVSQMTFAGGVLAGPAVAMPGFADGSNIAPAGTWYAIRFTGGGAFMAIAQKSVGVGTYATLSSGPTPVPVPGDVLRLEWDGVELRAYRNGALVRSHTPAAPIVGQQYVGVTHSTSAEAGIPVLDNWAGGESAPFAAGGTFDLSGEGTASFGGVPTTGGDLATSGGGALNLTGGGAGGGTLALSGAGTTSFVRGGMSAGGGLALAGAGSLSLGGKPALVASLARSGNGALSLSGAPRTTGTLARTGVGAVSFAATGLTQTGALALTGSGTAFLSSGPQASIGSLAFTGQGALILGAQVAVGGTLPRTGVGQLAFGGGAAFARAIALSGSGALTFGATLGTAGALVLSGSGSALLVGGGAGAGSLGMSGAGALLWAGKPGGVGSLARTGAGTLVLAGSGLSLRQTLARTGEGTLSLAAKVGTTGVLSLVGAGDLMFGGQPDLGAVLALSGQGTLTTFGEVIAPFDPVRHPGIMLSEPSGAQASLALATTGAAVFVGGGRGELAHAGAGAEILVGKQRAVLG